MRPLVIDFQADPRPLADNARWVRRILWSVVLSLAVADAAVLLYWQQENMQLEQALASSSKESSLVSGMASESESPGSLHALRALAAIASFDPVTLTKIEKAIANTRSKSPGAQLRLASLAFDAKQRKVILQGESAQHQSINQFREQLLMLFPQAETGFPSLRNSAVNDRATQFEIAIRLAPAIEGVR